MGQELPVVLVVDDEPRSVEALRRTLEEEFRVLCAASADEARAILGAEFVQVVLCDQRMPGQSGVALLAQVRELWPDAVRMIISGYTDPADIIGAVNEAGIYQFIHKPWHPEALLLAVRGAAELFRLQRDNEMLNLELRTSPPVLRRRVEAKREALIEQYRQDGMTRAKDSPLNAVCESVYKIARYDIPVLITGESGTGKELLARAIHAHSGRAGKAFVVENCAALPEQLLESELFGHKRGSFTGAYEDHVGLFERADGGTVFLDEIGDTSPGFQVKLLRVLQEHEIRPVGATRTRKVDVRVISATNADLEEAVRQGRFRADLYYRLTTFRIRIPALRERPMDVALIAEQVLRAAAAELGKDVRRFDGEALECLCAYHWPGNVRQLQNEVVRLVALCDEDCIGAELLSPVILRGAEVEDEGELGQLAGLDGTLRERVEKLEGRLIREVLIRHRWNKTRAAEELGLSRVGLRNKLERYGLGEAREPVRAAAVPARRRA